MATVTLVSVLSTVLAWADNLAAGSYFCNGEANFVTGEGSQSQTSAHTDIFAPSLADACPSEAGTVSYLSTGDFEGIQALIDRTRPFAGSDIPLSTEDKTIVESSGGRLKFSPVHQIPLYIDGWAIAYNVPCAGPAIKFSSLVLGLIFAGQITKWNDPRLTSIRSVDGTNNAWLSNCNENVQLIKRSDQAGATIVFQDYLSKRNPYWVPFRRQVGGLQWPALGFACSGKGDYGMRDCISSNRGSIGYVRMAVASGMAIGAVENASGSYVMPSSDSCAVAANTALVPPGVNSLSVPPTLSGVPRTTPPHPSTLGDWSAVSMTDAPDEIPSGRRAYPICALSYAFVFQYWYGAYAGLVGVRAARPVVDYFTVALYDSTQAKLPGIGLAPLPPRLRQIAREGVSSISMYRLLPAESAFEG